MSAPYLDQKILKRLLRYDPKTGIFVWRRRPGVPHNSRYAGRVAGFDWQPANTEIVYRSIRIFDWPFLGHRLAWLYMTGSWPKHQVDHADMDGLNNRWKNLRAATKQQNSLNRGASKRSSTGLKGAYVYGSRFRSQIKIGSKLIYLGAYDTPQAAHEAYMVAAREHHGEFARAE